MTDPRGNPVLIDKPDPKGKKVEGPPARYRLALDDSGDLASGGAGRRLIYAEADPETKIRVQPIKHEVIEQVVLAFDDAKPPAAIERTVPRNIPKGP